MAARRRRSGVRVVVVLLVVLAVLVAAFLVADRYVERRVEAESARQAQTELGTPTTPSVDVEGRPFLTQVVARRLPRVHVVADDLGADGSTTVPVAHTDLILTDVTTTDWFQTFDAAQVDGTARLDYAALATLAGVPLSSAGGGRVQVERNADFLGTDVAARVTGTPQLDVAAQTITLADPAITVAGVTIPDAASAALAERLLQPIAVQGLPLDLTVTSLTAGDDGVDVGVHGEDVQLQR